MGDIAHETPLRDPALTPSFGGTDLATDLSRHSYNEIVVTIVEYHQHMPEAVEAIVVLSEALHGTADDERSARRMRRQLIDFYASRAGGALRCMPPLLRFNGSAFEELDVSVSGPLE